MNFLNNVTEAHIRGLLALIVIGSVVAGFFTGIVSSEIFSGMVCAVLTYYYQGTHIVRLEKEKEEVKAALQSVQAQGVSMDIVRKTFGG